MPLLGLETEPTGANPSRSSRAGGGGTNPGTGGAVGGDCDWAALEPGMYGFLGMVLGQGLRAGGGGPEGAPQAPPASAPKPSASEGLACEGRSTSPRGVENTWSKREIHTKNTQSRSN